MNRSRAAEVLGWYDCGDPACGACPRPREHEPLGFTTTDGLAEHEPEAGLGTSSPGGIEHPIIRCKCGWKQDWRHKESWLDHFRATWTLSGKGTPELRQAAGAVLEAVKHIPIALGPNDDLMRALDSLRKALE